ncbi:MAG: glucoamylase family protein [Bacteroidota bacterium]
MPSHIVDLTASDRDLLDQLQESTFRFFSERSNPENGLVPDNSRDGAASSIAATGMGLACLVVGAERGYIGRAEAAERVRTTLRFFHDSEQSGAPDATGYRGFYYHFLGMETGRRAMECELSTIDTTFLLAGGLLAAQYFDRSDPVETDLRTLADTLNRRADWPWATNEGTGVSHGWTPEEGFLKARWQGYNESLLLYVLALGSPTFPIGPEHYDFWLETYRWKTLYGTDLLWGGPLFVHQFSHAWIDFRGIQDAYMRDRGIDYFENSRRATRVQQAYAVRNTRGRRGYGEHGWGITASDGPGPARHTVDGEAIDFYHYRARSVPWGPDDGTLAPWSVATSLPFAPEIVLPTLHHLHENVPHCEGDYGFLASFNPTFPNGSTPWVSSDYYGIDQGPVVLMIENHRNELLWRLMRSCDVVLQGLRQCGFTGGWLGEAG